jgi:hypothetical protein
MNSYLSNVIARAGEQPQSIRPRLASLFEPPAGPAIPMATNALGTKRNVPPRSVSQPHEDRTAPTQPVAPDVAPLLIHRSAESIAKQGAQASVSVDKTTTASPFNLPVENPPQPLIPAHPAVSSRVEPVLDPAGPIPSLHYNEAESEHIQASAEGQARREETRPTVESTPATFIDRTILIEAPIHPRAEPEVVVREVDRSIRPWAPRPASALVRPEMNLSLAAPVIARESSSVRITIGRIDVRAIMPPQPQPAAPAHETKRVASLSLEEYLKQRNGA